MPEKKQNLQETLRLEPGTLWSKITQQTELALRCGALQLFPTEQEFLDQGGVHFLVRVLPNLARKDEAKKQQDKETATSGKEFNPFLPYEKDLFVADISDTHLCILNKFSIVKHHLLIITREFEEQETLLNVRDFAALWVCLTEIDGLAFYNSGKNAGASQRHKHLQLVPLPLVPTGQKIPIEPILTFPVARLPFVHAIAQLDPQQMNSPLAASYLLECYHNLLQAVDWLCIEEVSPNRLAGAYNLIATRQWMLLVPRTVECFESISVNSLGFAGTLVVRSEQQMKILKEAGPMTVLLRVAVPAAQKA